MGISGLVIFSFDRGSTQQPSRTTHRHATVNGPVDFGIWNRLTCLGYDCDARAITGQVVLGAKFDLIQAIVAKT